MSWTYDDKTGWINSSATPSTLFGENIDYYEVHDSRGGSRCYVSRYEGTPQQIEQQMRDSGHKNDIWGYRENRRRLKEI